MGLDGYKATDFTDRQRQIFELLFDSAVLIAI